jgi:hypothetical protein
VSGSDLECARPRAQQRDKEIKLSDNSSAKDDSKLAAAEDGRTPGDISLVRIIGEPTTPNEAATLAEEDKFQFQWWALGLVGARRVEQKKGTDHGVDGRILFRDDPKAAKPEQTSSRSKAVRPA